MSAVLMATTLGAVLGPMLGEAERHVVAGWGLDPLLGPFVVALIAYALGALVLAVALRPDPLLVAARVRTCRSPRRPGRTGRAYNAWREHVAAAVGIMIIAQGVMVAIMTMTPVHLTQHHHGIGVIGGVIAAHVAAMYLPSPLSGWLVDRYGSVFVAILAGWVLIMAGVVAAVTNPGRGGRIVVRARPARPRLEPRDGCRLGDAHGVGAGRDCVPGCREGPTPSPPSPERRVPGWQG